MLTIRELLMQLPEDVRQLAIDNTPDTVIDITIDSENFIEKSPVIDALYRAFAWSDSPQGFGFWRNVKNNL